MKRLNGVVLDGVLFEWQEAPSLVAKTGEDCLLGLLITDGSMGAEGRHAVLFQARLAAEVRAYLQAASAAAAGDAALEMTVWGYLWGNKAVVADRVSFHVSEAVRMAAARVVRAAMGGSARANLSRPDAVDGVDGVDGVDEVDHLTHR